MDPLRQQLQDSFGLDDFRRAQRDVIEDVLSGKDVLCVMPTGAGKSLCYQLPAVVGGGLTIVVSPLIALMEDQVRQLQDENIPAAYLNSSMSATLQREALAQIESGFTGLLYVAPERFFAPTFANLMGRLQVKLMAVDEAHCISQWGHDFRPEYQQLGAVRERLGSPPCIALTATATDDVRQDIISGLNLREPSVVVTGFDRPNLSYQAQRIGKVSEKTDALLRLLRDEPGGAIVYCATRKAVDGLVPMIAGALPGRVVVPYHAGMPAPDRSANQEHFMQAGGAVAIATNAFGMGINKPDIRLVVHMNVPSTLEAYYQEAGRAGRDGQPARCVTLFNFQDRRIQEFFIQRIGQDRPEIDQKTITLLQERATTKLDAMVGYVQSHLCRRRQILDYFGDDAEVPDCTCDICQPDGSIARAPIATEISDGTTLLIRQLLSGIARLKGGFGVVTIAEVLAGSSSDRTARWGFEQLSVFGLLKSTPTKRLIAMLHRLIESGLARQRNVGVDGKPMYVVELTAAGVAVMKSTTPPPLSLADLSLVSAPTRERASRADRSSARERKSFELSLDQDAEQRFQSLRMARAELARVAQLPAYCICHDQTLKLIAIERPGNLQSLEQIKGMGPNRVKAYGEKLLAALGRAVD